MGVVLLVIAVALVALVAVMTWLGLTGKFGQGNPSPSPRKCDTLTPLQLVPENVTDYPFDTTVSVFTNWAIVGTPYNFAKGRVYLYKRVFGAWDHHQEIQASDGSDSNLFGISVSINEKNVVVGAPWRDTGGAVYSGYIGGVYMFTQQGETWTEDIILTASDMTSGDRFGWSVAISGDTLLVGAPGKDIERGAAYVFVLAEDGSWDEGTRLIPRNGTFSGYEFGWLVSLSGDSALIGSRYESVAYIFHRMNGVWQEEAQLVPTNGEASYYSQPSFDWAISGDTAMIGSPHDDDMNCTSPDDDVCGSRSGSVYVFIRQDDGTWEEVQKLTPADRNALDYFGSSVAISGDTAFIWAERWWDEGTVGAGYVYTKIDGKWTENITIVTEDGAGFLESRVAISGSTAIFNTRGEGGTVNIVDDLFFSC